MTWISVKDLLPEPEKIVLVLLKPEWGSGFGERAYEGRIRRAKRYADIDEWNVESCNSSGGMAQYVTNWLEIQEIPK